MARSLDSSDSLARVVTLSRWTEADARVVLAALAASGLTVAVFCARHTIDAQRVYLWRRKLASTVSPPPPFIEVAPAALHVTAPHTHTRYELVTAHGESLRIDGAIDASTIRALLSLLREGGAC